MPDVKNYSVFIVEDQEGARERVRRIIDSHPQLFVLGDAHDCQSAKLFLDNHQPDVMLVDLGLPDGNGIDLIKEIGFRGYNTEIMVLTVLRDEKHVLSAIEAGATGYLLKDGDPEYIGDSIIRLVNGDSPISASIARHLLKRFNNIDTKTFPEHVESPQITKREKEVLQYVAKGFNAPEISEMLSLSTHTVSAHIKHIYKKLAVKSRTEAVYEAVKLGLVDL